MNIREVEASSREAQLLMAELDDEIVQRYPGNSPHGIDAQEFRKACGYFALMLDPATNDAIGCAAFRPVTEQCAEIKRMYVRLAHRGRGNSKLLLSHVEAVARQRGFRIFVLETGDAQPEAIRLYRSAGYFEIPRFGDYATDPRSICFAKEA
jgi:GNAT superfamily N-acetyltransferase